MQNRVQFVSTDVVRRPTAMVFPAKLASGARSRSDAPDSEEASEFEVAVESEPFDSAQSARLDYAVSGEHLNRVLVLRLLEVFLLLCHDRRRHCIKCKGSSNVVWVPA